MVSVKVPDTLMSPVPDTKVWKLPKLVPVGVFNEVDPRPVKVSMNALPMPPRNVTEFVPLPEHPLQVKTPEVENVTGSANAAETPNPNTKNNVAASLNLKSILAPTGAPAPVSRSSNSWAAI